MVNNIIRERQLHKRIAVIAVYIPNVVEIPFEENCGILLEKYQEFLTKCSDIMKQEKGYKDLIVHNTCVLGIFDSRMRGELERVAAVSLEIHNVLRNMEGSRECFSGTLYFGVGVAAGSAIQCSFVNSDIGLGRAIWMGKAIDEALSLAKIAFCDGSKLIRIADTIFKEIQGP